MAWLFHGLLFSHVWRFLVVCGSWRLWPWRLWLLWAPFVPTLVSVRLRPCGAWWEGPGGSLPPVAAAGPSWPSLAPCASRLRTALLLSPAWRRQWPEKLEEAEFHSYSPWQLPQGLSSPLHQLTAEFLAPREYVHPCSSLLCSWRLWFCFCVHPTRPVSVRLIIVFRGDCPGSPVVRI